MGRVLLLLIAVALCGCKRGSVPSTPIYPKATAVLIPLQSNVVVHADGHAGAAGLPFTEYVNGWDRTPVDSVEVGFDGGPRYMVRVIITTTMRRLP